MRAYELRDKTGLNALTLAERKDPCRGLKKC